MQSRGEMTEAPPGISAVEGVQSGPTRDTIRK